MVVVPFVKWVGGKAQLVDELLERLPSSIGTYYEPFVGGGALFFALASEKPRRYKRGCLLDANEELINTYQVVRDDPESLMRALDLFGEHINKKMYYVIRDDEPADSVERAARFIYLNKTGFRGMYRVNREGTFNIPYGHYKKPPVLYMRKNLLACSRALRGVDLVAADFSEVLDAVCRGDAVYFDPPYVPVTATANFTGYTKDGFGHRNQRRLCSVARRCARGGAHVLLSNSDVPVVHGLYYGCSVEVVNAWHAVNPHEKGKGSRAKKTEVIISIPAR